MADKPLKINWLANLGAGQGYSGSSEQTALALERRDDVDVRLIGFESSRHATLSKAGKRLKAKPFEMADVGIAHGFPASFTSLMNHKYKVGFTMFESDKLPAGHTPWTGDADSVAEQLNKLDLLFTPSSYCVKLFRDHGVTVPIEVIPNGINPNHFPFMPRPAGRKPFTFLMMATLTQRKNPGMVISAFSKLFGDNPDVRLVLKTQSGTLGHLTFAKEMGRIEVIDELYSNEQISDLLKQADCFVFPCFSDDTKILSKQGFKGPDELSVGDPVLTLNPETGVLEDDVVVNKWVKDYDGPMVKMKSSRIDALVTPNHRVYYSTPKLKGTLKVRPAEELVTDSQTRHEIPITGDWKGNDEDWVVPADLPGGDVSLFHTAKALPNKVDTESMMRLLGWFVAEGTIHRPAEGGAVVSICNTDPTHLDEIERVIQEIGLVANRQPDRVTFNSVMLASILDQCGGLQHNRTIPNWVLEYSPRHLKVLFDAMIKGDGSDGEKCHHVTYYTSSTKLRDKFIELCFKLGYSVKSRTRPPADRVIQGRPVSADNTLPNYAIGVSLIYTKGTLKGSEHISKQNYKGKVWCVETRNQTVVAERNGSVYVSGNSRGEGFGMPPLEAMATGLPVILSANTGMLDFCDERYNYPIKHDKKIPCDRYPKSWGDVGNYFEPDYEDLKRLMMHVYENQDEAKAKGICASEWVQQEWNYNVVAEKIVSAINKLLSGGYTQGAETKAAK